MTITHPECSSFHHSAQSRIADSVKPRVATEKRIARQFINDVLSSGYKYSISVHDGETFVLRRSRNASDILYSMATTDEDVLHIVDATVGTSIGWVKFIYGNSGWDVISDHSGNLDELLAGVNGLVDQLSKE